MSLFPAVEPLLTKGPSRVCSESGVYPRSCVQYSSGFPYVHIVGHVSPSKQTRIYSNLN